MVWRFAKVCQVSSDIFSEIVHFGSPKSTHTWSSSIPYSFNAGEQHRPVHHQGKGFRVQVVHAKNERSRPIREVWDRYDRCIGTRRCVVQSRWSQYRRLLRSRQDRGAFVTCQCNWRVIVWRNSVEVWKIHTRMSRYASTCSFHTVGGHRF